MNPKLQFLKSITGRFYNRLQILHLCNYLLFSFFCFCFLNGIESDVLLLSLTKISGCHIPYIPCLYAILLTAIFLGLQILLNSRLKLDGEKHALSFIPSFLLLAASTNLVPSISITTSIFLVSGLALFVLIGCFHRRVPLANVSFPRLLIPNLICMLGGFTFVALVSNTNDELHYELRIQELYAKGKIEKALNVGNESLVTNRRLLALRALSLARKGELGESIFEYPIPESCTDLFLHPSDTSVMILPLDSIANVIGYIPSEKGCIQQLFNHLSPTSLRKHPSLRDYWLCTFLLQKRLDDFAKWLPHFYDISNKLPKHYREALILYRSLFVHPRIIYNGTATEVTNYTDFTELADKYTDTTERKNYLRRLYGNTYWWFYFESS